MLYKVQNLTMDIEETDGEFAGDCICYIPFSHKRFFKDGCGVSKNERFTASGWEHVFEHQYGEIYIHQALECYYTTSPDMLIAYLSWLMSEEGEQTVKVEYEKPFWAIHDAQHAIHDEAGCSIYVDAEIELERLHEAFKLMIKNDFKPDRELIEEVTEAYNSRFGKDVTFEEYQEPEMMSVDYMCPVCSHEWNIESEYPSETDCPECETEDVEAHYYDYV